MSGRHPEMGRGTDLARAAGADVHADLIDDLKEQLLIIVLKRLRERYGDDLVFPVSEVDDTGGDLLAFSVDAERRFRFELRKKS